MARRGDIRRRLGGLREVVRYDGVAIGVARGPADIRVSLAAAGLEDAEDVDLIDPDCCAGQVGQVLSGAGAGQVGFDACARAQRNHCTPVPVPLQQCGPSPGGTTARTCAGQRWWPHTDFGVSG
ncbi:hypothetical protein [Streptomyces sp. NPDC058613]|uniref:hypothetical protein n=1 Tax=Streptomyces sp. NPDC058613 TaxID=3346556 RepID=UPI0036493283